MTPPGGSESDDAAYTAAQLVGLPGMPSKSLRAVYLHAGRRGMVRVAAAKPARWLASSLPVQTRRHLFRTYLLAGESTADAAWMAGEYPIDPERGRITSAGHGLAAPPHSSRGGAADLPRPDQPWAIPPASCLQAAPAGLLSEADAAVADARLEVLTAFERWRAAHGGAVVHDDRRRWAHIYKESPDGVSPATRAQIPRVCATTLANWAARHRADGWRGLAPRRAPARRRDRIAGDRDLHDFIVAQVLERPRHVNCKFIMRALRAHFDRDRVPGYRTLQRFVAGWLSENARLVSAIADPDRHRSKYQPAGGDAAAAVTRLNQLWEPDSTPADVLCTDGTRAIVATIDVYSRRARVLVTPTSRATAIAALLRRCLLDWGVPECVRTDDGSDYTSHHIRRALADLHIYHDVLPPYCPEKKPFIERFLKTLSHGLLERLPGFKGHSIAEQIAIRAQKSFAARRGEGDMEAFQVACTAAELQATIDAWLANVYEREVHGGLDGRSPFEVAAAWPGPASRVADVRALDVLLAEPAEGGGWRTVQKKGIGVEATWFIAGALGGMVGERVQVRLDAADAGRVTVFDADGGFVCTAVAAEREGVDRQAVAAEMKAAAKEADREARAYARALKRAHDPGAAVAAILGRAQADAGRVVAFPQAAQAHRTPALDAALEAATPPERPDIDPEERRRAVAEIHRLNTEPAAAKAGDELSAEDLAEARAIIATYQNREAENA